MTSHFADGEFLCGCHRTECDAPKAPHRLLRLFLDRAREMYGEPIVITSGNRCAFHNAAVGGEVDSEHLHPAGCVGCDVAAATSRERYALRNAFYQAGFRRFGQYRDGHLHVGVGDVVDSKRWVPDVEWVR